MSIKEKVLAVLNAAASPMLCQDIAKQLPGTPEPSIRRAISQLHKKGMLSYKPTDPAHPGLRKLWTPTNAANPAPNTVNRNFKGSSGKVIAMCLPVNKPTLVTATIQTIEFFLSQKTEFSAHDVTKKLRELVKDGLAHVDDTECGTVFAYGRKVPKIEHEDVRGIVHEYFGTGKMTNYIKVMDGDHWKYSPDTAQVIPTPPTVTPAPMPQSSDYDGDPTL